MKHIKCVIVGDGTVGKSTLLISYTTNNIQQDYVPTVFDNYSANILVDSEPYQLDLWDTAGQEDYDKLRPLSYPNTNVFLVCFSIVSLLSYRNIKNKWIPELRFNMPNTKFLLVGTKMDLRDDMKVVERLRLRGEYPITPEMGHTLAQEVGAIKYIECSSYTFTNIKIVFEEAIKSVIFNKTNNCANKNKKKCVIL